MKKKLLRPLAICLGFFCWAKGWFCGIGRILGVAGDNFKMGIDGRGGAVYN